MNLAGSSLGFNFLPKSEKNEVVASAGPRDEDDVLSDIKGR